jgi:hypothetical protein
MKTKTNRNAIFAALAASATIVASTSALAGRPLTVDDANTNEKGAGHIEIWAAREAGKAETFNIAPAYAPYEGFEISAVIARERKSATTATALQGKYVITKSDENGCNLGVVAGLARVSKTDERATYVNGLVTCNGKDIGSAHFNLGGIKARGESTVRTWGVAVEREMGPVTPNLEWYGARGEKPTVQAGLRSEIVKSIQLDGTVGRTDGENIYSVGMKIQF